MAEGCSPCSRRPHISARAHDQVPAVALLVALASRVREAWLPSSDVRVSVLLPCAARQTNRVGIIGNTGEARNTVAVTVLEGRILSKREFASQPGDGEEGTQ